MKRSEQQVSSGLPRPTMSAVVTPGVTQNHVRVKRSKRPRQAASFAKILASIYWTDLAAADAIVDALKARGLNYANRSWLIRMALRQMDVEKAVAAARAGGVMP